MKKMKNSTGKSVRNTNKIMQSGFPGYPIYAESEDIYSKCKNEKELNPKEFDRMKELEDNSLKYHENDFNFYS